MKNGKLMTDYLDECAVQREMGRSEDIAILEALEERIITDKAYDLYQACLADGWTVAEIDTAYERRFNVRIRRA